MDVASMPLGSWADWITGGLTCLAVFYAAKAFVRTTDTTEIETLERLSAGLEKASVELTEASRREQVAREANDDKAHELAIEDLENAFSRKLNFLEQVALACNNALFTPQSRTVASDLLKDALAEIYHAPFFNQILNDTAARGNAMVELYKFASFYRHDIEQRRVGELSGRVFPPP